MSVQISENKYDFRKKNNDWDLQQKGPVLTGISVILLTIQHYDITLMEQSVTSIQVQLITLSSIITV